MENNQSKNSEMIFEAISSLVSLIILSVKICIFVGTIVCLFTWNLKLDYFWYAFLGAFFGGLCMLFLESITNSGKKEQEDN